MNGDTVEIIKHIDAKVGPILAAMKDVRPEVRVAMLQALGRYRGPKAFQAVREGVKHPDPKVQDAAVRALASWDDPVVMHDLQRLAAFSDNKTHSVLALRGLVRLARERAGKSANRTH